MRKEKYSGETERKRKREKVKYFVGTFISHVSKSRRNKIFKFCFFLFQKREGEDLDIEQPKTTILTIVVVVKCCSFLLFRQKKEREKKQILRESQIKIFEQTTVGGWVGVLKCGLKKRQKR